MSQENREVEKKYSEEQKKYDAEFMVKLQAIFAGYNGNISKTEIQKTIADTQKNFTEKCMILFQITKKDSKLNDKVRSIFGEYTTSYKNIELYRVELALVVMDNLLKDIPPENGPLKNFSPKVNERKKLLETLQSHLRTYKSYVEAHKNTINKANSHDAAQMLKNVMQECQKAQQQLLEILKAELKSNEVDLQKAKDTITKVNALPENEKNSFQQQSLTDNLKLLPELEKEKESILIQIQKYSTAPSLEQAIQQEVVTPKPAQPIQQQTAAPKAAPPAQQNVTINASQPNKREQSAEQEVVIQLITGNYNMMIDLLMIAGESDNTKSLRDDLLKHISKADAFLQSNPEKHNNKAAVLEETAKNFNSVRDKLVQNLDTEIEKYTAEEKSLNGRLKSLQDALANIAKIESDLKSKDFMSQLESKIQSTKKDATETINILRDEAVKRVENELRRFSDFFPGGEARFKKRKEIDGRIKAIDAACKTLLDPGKMCDKKALASFGEKIGSVKLKVTESQMLSGKLENLADNINQLRDSIQKVDMIKVPKPTEEANKERKNNINTEISKIKDNLTNLGDKKMPLETQRNNIQNIKMSPLKKPPSITPPSPNLKM